MLNPYTLDEQLRQRVDALRREMEQTRLVAESRRRPAAPARFQIVRPDDAQYGARIWRFRSFPAWSRGSSATKSTERGRL